MTETSTTSPHLKWQKQADWRPSHHGRAHNHDIIFSNFDIYIGTQNCIYDLVFASSSKPGFKLFQVLQPAHSISDSFFNPSLKLHGNVLKFSAKSHKLLKLRVKISRVGISHYFGTNNAIVQGLWFLMSMFSEQIQFGLLKKISEKCQLTFCPK